MKRRDARYLGHNPAGAAMIIFMLVLLTTVSVSGALLTTDAFWGSDGMDMIHGGLANVTLFCVVVHIAGVLAASACQRENLVWSMITGRKRRRGDRDI